MQTQQQVPSGRFQFPEIYSGEQCSYGQKIVTHFLIFSLAYVLQKYLPHLVDHPPPSINE